MVSPDPEPSRRRITMGQWASEREVDLLERDANLDDVVFPVRTLDWHGGAPNDDQLVDVVYENTFTASRRMRQRLIDTLWAPDFVQLVDLYVRHVCSDGTIYEIKWRPHTQRLSSLLPPNGSCYTLVAAFLLREQERQDSTESDGSEPGSEPNDDDVLTDAEPVNVDAVLAAPAPVIDLSCAACGAPAAVPDDSDSPDDDLSLDRFARARTMFRSMYEAHNEMSDSEVPETHSV